MITAREPNEILVETRLPLLRERATFGFYEFNRRAGDFALGMCLATFTVTDGVMSDVRVGLGGIESASRRLFAVEGLLEGRAAVVGGVLRSRGRGGRQSGPDGGSCHERRLSSRPHPGRHPARFADSGKKPRRQRLRDRRWKLFP